MEIIYCLYIPTDIIHYGDYIHNISLRMPTISSPTTLMFHRIFLVPSPENVAFYTRWPSPFCRQLMELQPELGQSDCPSQEFGLQRPSQLACLHQTFDKQPPLTMPWACTAVYSSQCAAMQDESLGTGSGDEVEWGLGRHPSLLPHTTSHLVGLLGPRLLSFTKRVLTCSSPQHLV